MKRIFYFDLSERNREILPNASRAKENRETSDRRRSVNPSKLFTVNRYAGVVQTLSIVQSPARHILRFS
jgi:hypothetical protein